VEWNPPAASPSLSSVLKWPKRSFHVPLRIISVDEAAASTLDFLHRDPFPQVENTTTPFRFCFANFSQFYAKNIALRRARGQWLLITNADILLGEQLFAFMAQRTLDTGSFYRIDRHDLNQQAQVAGSRVRQGTAQEWCIDHVASVMTMTTMGVGGLMIEDLGVSPDRWGGYNVTHWGHLRVRFGDDGSGQLGYKIETKSGGARDYWNTVTDVYKRGDGTTASTPAVIAIVFECSLQVCPSFPSPTTAAPAKCGSCTRMLTATSCDLPPRTHTPTHIHPPHAHILPPRLQCRCSNEQF
jgi:hypothetical protein